MPGYKKKGFRRKYKKKPQGWISRAGSAFNMAYKALTMSRMVKNLVNAEAKDYYVSQATFASTNSGSVIALNNLGQGVTDGTRTGDSIKCKTVTIRGDMTRNGNDDIVRVLLVWDKENTSSVSTLLQYSGSSQVVNSPKQDDRYYQTKILFDRNYVVDTDNPKRMFKIVCPVNAHTKFNNTALTTVMNGALYLYVYSQQAAAGTNVELVSKLTFMDN